MRAFPYLLMPLSRLTVMMIMIFSATSGGLGGWITILNSDSIQSINHVIKWTLIVCCRAVLCGLYVSVVCVGCMVAV